METAALLPVSNAELPSDEPDSPAPGTLIANKYRLERTLGAGGMGTVWIARNVALNVPVALKLIRPEVRAHEAAERLLVEARVEAQLNHPGIVRVFDYGETQSGDAYIVMELLEGRTLADLLQQRGKLAPALAIQILLPIVDALCHAHEHGIVHRDLKPDNIFLARGPRGVQPKVLDFGIAKCRLEDDFRARTRGGVVLGSPAYMAPEQARGLVDVDVRADVWSLCVVLYEAVSGKPAFNGDNYNQLLRAVIEDQVEPLHEAGEGEAALWSILQRGLSKERSLRFAALSDLGNALAHWLSQRGVMHDVCGGPLSQQWKLEAPRTAAVATTQRMRRVETVASASANTNATDHATPVPAPAASQEPPDVPAPRLPILSLGLSKHDTSEVPMAVTLEGALRRPRRRAGLGLLAAAACALLVGFAAQLQERFLAHGASADSGTAAAETTAAATAPVAARPAPVAAPAPTVVPAATVAAASAAIGAAATEPATNATGAVAPPSPAAEAAPIANAAAPSANAAADEPDDAAPVAPKSRIEPTAQLAKKHVSKHATAQELGLKEPY